ncbi:MAG TPA: hypothetical protein VIJ59_07155 [Caulobacteraceae bacterium]
MTATSHGPTAAEQAKVSYLDVRDQFLAISNEGEYAEWLAKVGRYVHDRWLAEELTRTPGQPLDEEACKHLWDECSRKNLTDLQGEALVNLTDYRQRKVLASLGGLLTRGGRRVPVAVAGWTLRTMLEGFVGGIGLIVLGLLFVLLAPKLADDIRGTLHDVLPAAAHCPTGQTHLSDPANC